MSIIKVVIFNIEDFWYFRRTVGVEIFQILYKGMVVGFAIVAFVLHMQMKQFVINSGMIDCIIFAGRSANM